MTSRLTKKKPKAQLEEEKKTAEYFAAHCAMVFSLLPFVRSDDRKTLYKWLEKFRSSNDSEEDRRNRNDYIWFMLIQMESGTVTFPFTGPPPKGPLVPLLQFMPKQLYIKIMKVANQKLLDYEEALQKVSKDPCPIPAAEPKTPVCILKKKPGEENKMFAETLGSPYTPKTTKSQLFCPREETCPQLAKQTICPEETCPRSPWSKPAALFRKPPKLHVLRPGEQRIPLYEAAIRKCKPSEFLGTQPKPKRGFIAYGACFSDQMNMLV